MHSIWPAYDGSVRTSWYPVIAVLKTTSPTPMTSAPSGVPTNARPSSSTRAACLFGAPFALAGNDHRLVDPVLFLDQDLDPLGVRGRHVLADVVRADRQLAMAAVDQDRQLDRAWASEVHQRIHGRTRSASVVDDVVDEYDHLAVYVGHVRDRSMGGFAQVSVVAVLAGVENTDG